MVWGATVQRLLPNNSACRYGSNSPLLCHPHARRRLPRLRLAAGGCLTSVRRAAARGTRPDGHQSAGNVGHGGDGSDACGARGSDAYDGGSAVYGNRSRTRRARSTQGRNSTPGRDHRPRTVLHNGGMRTRMIRLPAPVLRQRLPRPDRRPRPAKTFSRASCFPSLPAFAGLSPSLW